VEARLASEVAKSSTRISRSQYLKLKGLTVFADVIAMAAALVSAYALRSVVTAGDANAVDTSHYVVLGLSVLPITVLSFSRYRLYRGRGIAGRLGEFRRVAHATLASVATVALLSFMIRFEVSRGWLVLMFGFGLLFTTVERAAVRRLCARQRGKGHSLR